MKVFHIQVGFIHATSIIIILLLSLLQKEVQAFQLVRYSCNSFPVLNKSLSPTSSTTTTTTTFLVSSDRRSQNSLATTTTTWMSPSSSSSEEQEVSTSLGTIDEQIDLAMIVLNNAAETKAEESDDVVDALLDLEKLMRQKNKENLSAADDTLDALCGYDKGQQQGGGGASWRLIFTTGTIKSQEKNKGRINYFPLKATQSFKRITGEGNDDDDDDMYYIENGVGIGDFTLAKFSGTFDWRVLKNGTTKLEFDFDTLRPFDVFEIKLKPGEAANLGAKSGLGSESNIQLEKQGKNAFFNWISADDKIATARGGGGGLALWKRVEYEGRC